MSFIIPVMSKPSKEMEIKRFLAKIGGLIPFA